MIDIKKLNEPSIRVEWHDTPEAFTNEKMRRVKSYFQQKYSTKNVTVKPVAVIDNAGDAKLQTLEINDSILDLQYQKKLVKEYIKENKINIDWDKINRLDDRINSEISKDGSVSIRFNKWVLKKIEFSNFLSYGPNNILDFSKYGGITVIESNPKNFGGKTVLSVDLIMFLLFNTTTKSKTQEQIFNKFTDENEVTVRGYLEIDNQDFIIERTVQRKKKKTGEYDAKTDLTFHKLTSAGWENLSGEQRRETEEFIKSAIGDKEDFLTTILTTGSNLEDLLEAKATARGLLFTKFLGLDSLRKKEEVCKTIYSDWSKKLVSNQYNVIALQANIKKGEDCTEEQKKVIANGRITVNEAEKYLELLLAQRDALLVKQYNDIDESLAKLNPTLFKKEIEQIEQKIKEVQNRYDNFIVVEPSEYYYADKHAVAQDEFNNLKVERELVSNKKSQLGTQLVELREGTICPTCKRSLEDVDHSEEIKLLEQQVADNEEKLYDAIKRTNEKKNELQAFILLKQEFDDYDRNKLIKEKYSIEIQQHQLDLQTKNNKLSLWESNKAKLESNLLVQADLIKIKTAIDTKSADINNLKDSVKEAERTMKTCENDIVLHMENIEKIKKEEDIQKVFQTYLNIYGKNGIAKSIMRNMIPLINKELERILFDTCQFSLVISINDKNEVEFIKVDNETRVEAEMSSGSGYEKTVASLALRAVLSKVSALPKPNIIVMDEVFGRIADENLDMVGEFFNKIKNYFEHILLIVHNPLVKNWADHVIQVKKENNISFVE